VYVHMDVPPPPHTHTCTHTHTRSFGYPSAKYNLQEKMMKVQLNANLSKMNYDTLYMDLSHH